MSEVKIKDSFEKLTQAMQRMGELLQEMENQQDEGKQEIYRDALIKRFEFTWEIYWKTFQRIQAYLGYTVNSPRESFRQAYQLGWMDNEAVWLSMLKDRNLTVHVYDESIIEEICGRIVGYYQQMRMTFEYLEKKYTALVH